MAEVCDICRFKDGWKGLQLLKCQMCGVCFHATCYGINEDRAKEPNYVCKACDAIGKSIPVHIRGSDSSIVQHQRPTECVLCSVSDGVHAMHPIYDAHGRNGRQVVLPANDKMGLPERLGWIHTLCAFVTIQNGSLVYACDERGRYVNEEGEWVDPDNNNATSSDNNDDSLVETHHFVECGKENGEHTVWSRDIEEKQQYLKCSICAIPDKVGALRFAMQCTAGNPSEYFRQYHKEMEDDNCYVPLHIGCAMWGNKNSVCRQVYFYPGAPGDTEGAVYNDPVAEVYCAAHAKDVDDGMQAKTQKKKVTTAAKKVTPARPVGAASKPLMKNPPVKKAPRKNLAYERRLKKKTPVAAAGKSLSKKVKQTSTNLLGSPPPSFKSSVADAAKPVRSAAKYQKSSIGGISKIAAASRRASELSSTKRAATTTTTDQRRHSAPEVNTLDNINALAFPKKRKKAGEQKTEKSVKKKKDWFSIISEDLDGRFKAENAQGTTTAQLKEEVIPEIRKHWKKETGLPKTEWKNLWADVKNYAQILWTQLTGSEETTKVLGETVENSDSPVAHVVNDAEDTTSPEVATEEEEAERRVTADSSRWKHLWVGDPNYSGDFEFGEWDSCKMSMTNMAE